MNPFVDKSLKQFEGRIVDKIRCVAKKPDCKEYAIEFLFTDDSTCRLFTTNKYCEIDRQGSSIITEEL